jgi:hypothetical protein
MPIRRFHEKKPVILTPFCVNMTYVNGTSVDARICQSTIAFTRLFFASERYHACLFPSSAFVSSFAFVSPRFSPASSVRSRLRLQDSAADA